MCKQCKLRKKVKALEVEVAELKAKLDSHMGHYIYPFTYTYPHTYTIPNTTITYTNGGISEG